MIPKSGSGCGKDHAPIKAGSAGDQAHRFVDRPQHAIEFVAAAHDQASGRDDAVGALPPRQLRVLLDPVERDFRSAAEHRKHRAVAQEINGVIAPLAGGDLAAIEAEDAVELLPLEGHSAHGGDWRYAGILAPAELTWLIVAWPKVHWRLHRRKPMIAPDARVGKTFGLATLMREWMA